MSKIENGVFNSLFDLDKVLLIPGKIRIQHHRNILVSYFNDQEDYNYYFQNAIDSLHDSIPILEKQHCRFKTGDDVEEHDHRCLQYLKKADEMFECLSYLFIIGIINNEDALYSRELKREMAIAFFDNLIFDKGILDSDGDRLSGIIINKLLDLKKEIYDETELIEDIIMNANENLRYLNDYRIKAKNLKRWTAGMLKPQIKFFENELEFYKTKSLFKKTENKSDTKPTSGDLVDYFEYTSKYQTVMSLLAKKGLVQTGNHIWIDKKKASKTLLASLIKTLFVKGYFINNQEATNKEIVLIAKNTFSKSISIDTSKRAPIDENYFSFIPLSSEL